MPVWKLYVYGILWFCMDEYGLLLFGMDFYGICMDFYGLVRISSQP